MKHSPFNILFAIWDSPQFPPFQYFDCFAAQSICVQDFFDFAITALAKQLAHYILPNKFTLVFLGLINNLLWTNSVYKWHAILIQVEVVIHNWTLGVTQRDRFQITDIL